ncbi:MAG: hypothetical protein JWQ36_1617 [Enterovirga sp.]|jgi:hypothetical protein|nr:hypothetical protein [Enterovirga sp.]
MRRRPFAFALILLTSAALLPPGRVAESRTAMSDLFDAIEAAIVARAGGFRAVGAALGAAFQGPVETSTEAFVVLRGRRSTLIEELAGAEIRVRRSTGAIRLMAVDVERHIRCTPERDIESRFGPPKDVAVPRPEQPPGAPFYRMYPQPWGELRIGTAGGCVVRVIAEFTEY